MSSFSAMYSFDIEADPTCWRGTPTAFERLLRRGGPFTNVEGLRARFLQAVTTTREPDQAVRALVQMAFETEIGVVLQKLVTLADSIFTSHICPRRTYIDIDRDMDQFRFLVEPAFAELMDARRIPEAYLRLYRHHIESPQPRYRVCATASLLCLTAYYYFGDGAVG